MIKADEGRERILYTSQKLLTSELQTTKANHYTCTRSLENADHYFVNLKEAMTSADLLSALTLLLQKI